jgi:ribosomal protein S18 acetylase RimI-like enzyme
MVGTHNRRVHQIRAARAADYDAIAAVVDAWWGRTILPALPRLFLDHFHRTSFVAEHADTLAGFLVGIVSPSQPDEAYVHFVGIHPASRGHGLGRALYDRFFALARSHDRHVVKAITAPANTASIAFHRRIGFTVGGPVTAYNGPGHDLVTFERRL